jgi:hypothetical protein
MVVPVEVLRVLVVLAALLEELMQVTVAIRVSAVAEEEAEVDLPVLQGQPLRLIPA